MMKTQSATIYHCVSCGRIVHSESETEAPQCCGQAMAIAVPETTTESAVPEEKGVEDVQTPPPVIEGVQKPR